jgi:hypothetical protein
LWIRKCTAAYLWCSSTWIRSVLNQSIEFTYMKREIGDGGSRSSRCTAVILRHLRTVFSWKKRKQEKKSLFVILKWWFHVVPGMLEEGKHLSLYMRYRFLNVDALQILCALLPNGIDYAACPSIDFQIYGWGWFFCDCASMVSQRPGKFSRGQRDTANFAKLRWVTRSAADP